jgi:voltage-gated sodium channel
VELLEAGLFNFVQTLVVTVFIVEAAFRLTAQCPKPQRYFRDGWNCFDFAIIILSLMPFAGQFSTVARLVRLLRITRLITKSTELRAIPSIFNILILLSILFFIYAVIGYHLFRNVDPPHWSSFPTSATTLFQIITLEGWVDVMESIVSNLGSLYWLYFASFILIGTFIVINLFISVIVRKSEEAYQQVQRESQIPLTQQEIIQEIKEIRRILEELEKRIGRDAKEKTQA